MKIDYHKSSGITYEQEEDPWADHQRDGETADSPPHRGKISELQAVRLLHVEEEEEIWLENLFHI